jgi:hypothetical protein
MLTHVERTPEAIAIEKEILRDSSLEPSADESGHDGTLNLKLLY